MPRSLRGRPRPAIFRAEHSVEDCCDQMDCSVSPEYHPSSQAMHGTLVPARRLPYYYSNNTAAGLGDEGDCLGMLLGFVLGFVTMGIIWILSRSSNIPALFKNPDDVPALMEPSQ